jgi:hypothetical protein
MKVRAGKGWAQESRKPIGEGDGARVDGYEILRVSMTEAASPRRATSWSSASPMSAQS